MKKVIPILLLCAAMIFAAGCGVGGGSEQSVAESEASTLKDSFVEHLEDLVPAEEEAYSALEAPALDGMPLEEGASSTLSARFPAGEWAYGDSALSADFMIYDLASLEANENVMNINAIISVDIDGQLSQRELDSLVAELQAMGATGMEIQNAEMRSLNGEPVIYMETVTRITEELLNLTIENGELTEEQIAELGGREALLSAPPTYQIQIYGVVEGKVLVITGSYYDEADKDRLVSAMIVVLETADVKE